MKNNTKEKIVYYIVLFYIFSFLGGILEISYSLIFRDKLVWGGFMYGMLRPIYGFGSLILYFVPKRLRKNILITFIAAFIIGSIYEYLSSYFLELLFHKRWWNYNNFFLNINGRICLLNSICWGILGIIFYYTLEPIVKKFYLKINKKFLMLTLIILSVYYLIDITVSFMKYLIH